MKASLSVLIVADSDVVAAALESALRDRSDVDVTLRRTRALRPLIDEHDPAVVVLATTTARATVELERLARERRAPAIVLLVDDPGGAWTASTRRAGVRAVLARDGGVEQIAAAVTAVTAGLIVLDPDTVRTRAAATRPGDVADDHGLTARQREILEMMAAGLSNRTIGVRLGISAFTVKFHVAAILRTLGAGTRTEAVTLGVRRGLISL